VTCSLLTYRFVLGVRGMPSLISILLVGRSQNIGNQARTGIAEGRWRDCARDRRLCRGLFSDDCGRIKRPRIVGIGCVEVFGCLWVGNAAGHCRKAVHDGMSGVVED
jgi:hypothetical protein